MRYQPTECILTEDELRERCAEWQEVLRLQDWQVIVRLVRGREIDGHAGRCNYQIKTRMALIRIMDAADWDNEHFPHDMERTLVHELLHLSTAWFSPDEDTAEGTGEEQHISAVSEALVALKRAGEGDTTITVHQDPGFTVQSGDGNTGEAFVPTGWGPNGPILERPTRQGG